MYDEKPGIMLPEKRPCGTVVKTTVLLLLVVELVLLLGLAAHCTWLTLETKKVDKTLSNTQEDVVKIEELPVIKSAFNQTRFIELVQSAVYKGIRADMENFERDLLLAINASESRLGETERGLEERVLAVEERLGQADIQDIITQLSATKSTLRDISLQLNNTEDSIRSIRNEVKEINKDIDVAEQNIGHLQDDTHVHDGASHIGLTMWAGVMCVTAFMTY